MKKLILLGLAIILFASCQQQEKKRYFSESAEIDVLKAGIDAYESGDWDTWKSHFADNGEIYVNSKDSITVDERLAQLKGATESLSSYGFDRDNEWIEMVIDSDEETWVYYWAQWNGEFTTTKKKISVPVHLSVQFEDGKISEEHIYFDGTEMNKAIAALTNMTDNEKVMQTTKKNE